MSRKATYRMDDGSVVDKASFDLDLIREAWSRGCDFEDLADGYGPGQGTNGDWSAIRDSTERQVEKMLSRALYFFHFGRK